MEKEPITSHTCHYNIKHLYHHHIHSNILTRNDKVVKCCGAILTALSMSLFRVNPLTINKEVAIMLPTVLNKER